DVLENAERHSLRYSGALVDALVGARLDRDSLDYLGDEIRNAHFSGAARGPRFLIGNAYAKLDGLRIVRRHFAADAILERRDDLAARGVVLGVRCEAEHHIERKAHRISFDLDIALLHDVEQAHLHFAGEVGQLVQREDPAIRPRQHAVVHSELVTEDVSTAGSLDWIEIAD